MVLNLAQGIPPSLPLIELNSIEIESIVVASSFVKVSQENSDILAE